MGIKIRLTAGENVAHALKRMDRRMRADGDYAAMGRHDYYLSEGQRRRNKHAKALERARRYGRA